MKTIKSKNGKSESKINNWLPGIWLIIILIITYYLFAPATKFEFVNWDDNKYVYENELIKDFSWENISHFFKNSYFLMYLPITMLSYMVDYSVDGYNPHVFHTTNIILHLLNTALVFVFFYLLGKIKNYKNSLFITITITFLFAINSLHIESVVWIAERKDVLYTFFYLFSLIFYLLYFQKNKLTIYLISLIFFALSLLSKAQAMPLAIILFFLDYFLDRKILDKKVIFEKIPFLILAVITGIIAILATRSEGVDKVDFQPFKERILNAAYAYIMYLVKLVYPYQMSAIYPYPKQMAGGSMPLYIWIFPALLLAVLASLIYSIKKHKEIVFGIAFYSLSIVLVLQVFTYHNVIMADRYSYVSAIGFFFIIAISLNWLINYKPVVKFTIYGVLAIYLCFLYYLSINRIQVWKNSIDLWSDVISKYTIVSTAYYNRGVAFFEKNQYKSALEDFNSVLRLDNKNKGALFSKGNALDKMGDVNQAIQLFNLAIEQDSLYVDAYANRGIALAKIGNIQAAVNDFNTVIRNNPKHSSAYSNRGNTKVILGDNQGALSDYSKAIELKPDYTDALFNRGLVFMKFQKFDEAIADFNSALVFKPDYPEAYYNRGIAYTNKKDWEKAVSDFNKALSQNPNYIDAIFSRGASFHNMNKFIEAINDFSTIINAAPNHAIVYYRRALSEQMLNKKEEACNDFMKSYQLGMQEAANDIRKYCK